ncbi:MAG: hypothetical protein HYS13_15350 [Planctomycetia bacterium]|nr:hypothetical protein [Planctomycetia bacterium]
MKKFVSLAALAGVGLAIFVGVSGSTAKAIPPFKKEWDGMYAKDGTPIAKAATEAKCNVCHKGTNKKMRNDYGMAISSLIKKTEKDPEKIRAAILKVEKMTTPDGKTTFGELIKEGKLPGGG